MDTTDSDAKTIEEFADSLLMPDQGNEQDETPEAPDDDQTEGEAAEAEEDPEAEESDEDEGDGEKDDDDSKDEGDEQPELITVKADGEEKQVTLEDLKRSYSGQVRIQRGMQEAAEAKKQAAAVYEALSQERAQIAQLAQQLQQGNVPKPPQMPPDELAQSDPLAYNAQLGQYFKQQQEYSEFQQRTQALTAQQSEAQERARQAYLAEQAKLLQQEIPELADAEKAGDVRQKLLSTGEEYGFSQDELAGITDARAVKVLNDARKWRELQNSKGKPAEKAKPRKVMKPGARKGESVKKARDEKFKRLKQTGRIDDAVDLLFE